MLETRTCNLQNARVNFGEVFFSECTLLSSNCQKDNVIFDLPPPQKKKFKYHNFCKDHLFQSQSTIIFLISVMLLQSANSKPLNYDENLEEGNGYSYEVPSNPLSLLEKSRTVINLPPCPSDPAPGMGPTLEAPKNAAIPGINCIYDYYDDLLDYLAEYDINDISINNPEPLTTSTTTLKPTTKAPEDQSCLELFDLGLGDPIPGINCMKDEEEFNDLMNSLPDDMMILNLRAMPEDEISNKLEEKPRVKPIVGKDFNLALGLSIY